MPLSSRRWLLPSSCRPVVLLVTVFCLNQSARAGSWWSSSSNWNINGHHTMNRSKDGIKRHIEGDVDIEIHDGQITQLKDGAVLKLEQTGGPQQRQAELRGTSAGPALWIKDAKGFHAGSEADQKWLHGFLEPFEDKPAPEPAEATSLPVTAADSNKGEAASESSPAAAKDLSDDDLLIQTATHMKFSVSRNNALESIVSSALEAKNYKLATRAADLIDFTPTKDAQLRRIVEAMQKDRRAPQPGATPLSTASPQP